MAKQKIEFNIPADLHFSSLVRNIAEEVFGFVHFSKEWSNRLKLVVDELFMNAVKYGSIEGTSTVHIIFAYDEKEASFQIEDDGTGPESVSVEELKSIISKNASDNNVTNTSGRGLALITSLWTDKIEVESSSLGGISISFVKTIETTPPPPPPIIQMAVPEPAQATPVPQTATTQDAVGPEFIVKLHGEIDQVNIDKLSLPVEDQIAALPEGAKLVLDFKEVDYINSTFIGHLASWHNDVKVKKGEIVIQNANAAVKDVLNLVGLERVLTIK